MPPLSPHLCLHPRLRLRPRRLLLPLLRRRRRRLRVPCRCILPTDTVAWCAKLGMRLRLATRHPAAYVNLGRFLPVDARRLARCAQLGSTLRWREAFLVAPASLALSARASGMSSASCAPQTRRQSSLAQRAALSLSGAQRTWRKRPQWWLNFR